MSNDLGRWRGRGRGRGQNNYHNRRDYKNNSSNKENTSYHQKRQNSEEKSVKEKSGQVKYSNNSKLCIIGAAWKDIGHYLSMLKHLVSVVKVEKRRCEERNCLPTWWFWRWSYWHNTFRCVKCHRKLRRKN